MNLNLHNKNVLVLGSSKGIGCAISKTFLAEGANVILSGRDEEQLKKLQNNLLEQYPNQVFSICVDFFARNSDHYIVECAHNHFDKIDILINNTGGPPTQEVLNLDTSIMTKYFDMMVVKIISITNALLPDMIENQWGRIINIVSSGVIQPIPELVISNSLRASIIAWAKTLANHVAKRGITVNTLIPGRIQTERTKIIDNIRAVKRDCSIEDVMAESVSHIPIGRYGSVEEFAAGAVFLASSQASYITGSCIRIDGGMIRAP